MIDDMLELLFPINKICYVCGKFIDGEAEVKLCTVCRNNIEETNFLTEFEFLSTKYYLTINSCVKYNDTVKKMLMGLKYQSKGYMARLFADMMVEIIPGDTDYLVPVPISKRRKFYRGYNQSRLIANMISKKTGVEVVDLLVRRRHTKALKDGTFEERCTQISHAIFINDNVLKPKHLHGKIIVIDDVLTSGATLHECGKALYRAGAINVHARVFAERDPEERKRIMNVNNLRNCNKCGRMFAAPNNEDLCERCRDSYNSELRQIKDYLYEFPNAQIREIAEGTGISTKIILRFIKEGKIILRSDDDSLKCDRCGTHISHGRFCQKCVGELTKGLKEGLDDKNRNKMGFHTKK